MRNRGRTGFIVAYLAPAVLIYAVFVIWPVLQAFGFSLFRWSGVSQKKRFVGLQNFKTLFHDDVFWKALLHNAWMFVFGGAAILLIGVGVAHATQGKGRMTKVLRSVYLFPNLMSLVVVAVLWQFIYNPNMGLLKAVVNIGRDKSHAINFDIIGGPHLALPGIIATFVWFSAGFYIMLFSAGIRQIPEEVIEASKLDGAEGMTRFRKITLPSLWAVGRIAIIYLVINTLNVFALVFLMTTGGPDRQTEVMLTYLYEQAFTNSDYGLATALAVANFVIVMVVSGLILRLTRKDPSGVTA